LSSSGIPSKYGFQVGGTATIVNGRWTGRATAKYTDPLGRWSSITIAGKNRKVTFITAYQCCNGGKDQGPYTWYKQLWERHKRDGVKNPKPRKLFLADLEKYIDGFDSVD